MGNGRIILQFILFTIAAAALFGYVQYMGYRHRIYDDCMKVSIVPVTHNEDDDDGDSTGASAKQHANLEACMNGKGFSYSAFSQCSVISDEEMCFTPAFLSMK